MRIGQYQLRNRLIAAPMAGITDRPFRTLCYEMGAGLTVSEMMSSNPQVWESDKSRLRMVHIDEPGIRTVQIAGSDPKEMADAARINVESGAQIIDINMGCPAKKVNRKLAGSALLQYPDVVKSILTEVVNAVDVPVTLKIRTGWAPEHRNCEEIAQLAEDCGIQALTIHGRTRACLFNGEAEYDSIRAVKQKVSIPVIANGDITDPLKARVVLDYTGADALMIGRAAQGRPWIFREIQHYLDTGSCCPRCLWQRLSACFARTFGNCMTFMVRQKGTELHVNTFPGISRNTLQMTSFGAHSTPLRMPANSWRRWRHTSKILRKQK